MTGCFEIYKIPPSKSFESKPIKLSKLKPELMVELPEEIIKELSDWWYEADQDAVFIIRCELGV